LVGGGVCVLGCIGCLLGLFGVGFCVVFVVGCVGVVGGWGVFGLCCFFFVGSGGVFGPFERVIVRGILGQIVRVRGV
ncbi:hypothetical protein RA262_29840, partial [Pseudomonas syringae pv. tagetis]